MIIIIINRGRVTDQLVGEKEDGLEAELAVTKIEQVLKGRPEQVENHGIVITFCAVPTNKGNADATSESLVDFRLVLELGVLGLD